MNGISELSVEYNAKPSRRWILRKTRETNIHFDRLRYLNFTLVEIANSKNIKTR